MKRLKAVKVKKEGFYKQEDLKQAEIRKMKTQYPGLFANGSNEDKLNAMVTKGGGMDDDSGIDDNE